MLCQRNMYRGFRQCVKPKLPSQQRPTIQRSCPPITNQLHVPNLLTRCSERFHRSLTWSRASLSSADCWVPASTRSRLESCILRSFIYRPVLNMISRLSILEQEKNNVPITHFQSNFQMSWISFDPYLRHNKPVYT